MAKSKTNPRVDAILSRADRWQEELAALREIILECQLTEDVRWGAPSYTFEGSNVVILISRLKQYCGLSFFKGALLKDASGILAKPGANTQSARVVRFTDVREIIKLAPVLKAYICEAIQVERAGLKVDFKAKTELAFPVELQERLDENPSLKAAFAALTPGRQRAYNLYFSGAKQSKTRAARVEKCMDRILDGKGLSD